MPSSTGTHTVTHAHTHSHTHTRARAQVREVCEMVARRSALLAAAALDAILTHTGWCTPGGPAPDKDTVVAVDGGVYERFGAYRRMLRESLERVQGEGCGGVCTQCVCIMRKCMRMCEGATVRARARVCVCGGGIHLHEPKTLVYCTWSLYRSCTARVLQAPCCQSLL